MSFLDLWRKIFGTPITYSVMELKKGRKYIFKIDCDDMQLIRAFQEKVKQAMKEGYILIPSHVVVQEIKKPKRGSHKSN